MTIEAPEITPPALSRIVPLIDEAASGRTTCAPSPTYPLELAREAPWSGAVTWINSSAAAANIRDSSCDGLRRPGLRVYPACTIMSSMASCVLALLLAFGQFGQSNTGELRITVTDSSGLPLPGPVEVVSDANEFRQR